MLKKIKFLLFACCVFSTFSIYSQEEFFGKQKGLTASSTMNFPADIMGTELSLHLKSGLFVSGSFMLTEHYSREIVEASIGYLVSDPNDSNGIKGIFGLSCGYMLDGYTNIGIYMGLMKVFYSKSNFPFSIGASASFSTSTYYNNPGLSIVPTIGYIQSFFAHNQVYPVIGITRSFLHTDNVLDGLFFHAGLNIKLSKPDSLYK